MKKIGTLIFVVVTIVSCFSIHSENEPCNCCSLVYNEIETASNCIEKNPITNTTSDHRLFLFALADQKTEVQTQKGWDILVDKEVIKIAQRDYLLITTDKQSLMHSNPELPEQFSNVITESKDGLLFIITNQALYPFAHWTQEENKKIIIDRLKIGNGP